MPKTIRITIDGLILWVPRKNGIMTLLMPSTTTIYQPHVAKLAIPPDPRIPGDQYKYPDFATAELNLPDATSNADALTHVPKRIPRIRPFSGKDVPKTLLEGPIDPTVLLARVNLRSGEWVGTSPPVTFTFGRRKMSFSNRIVWEMEHTEDVLKVMINGTEVPIPANDKTGEVIRFFICHVPERELPGKGHNPPLPSRPTPVPHFDQLYKLLGKNTTLPDEVPVFDSESEERIAAMGGVFGQILTELGLIKRMSDPVTCVGGTNPPDE